MPDRRTHPQLGLADPDRVADPDPEANQQGRIDDGAEIILGPLFAPMAAAVGPVAKPKGVPVIAFSSDRTVGGNGVYLLSFLPESDVKRIVDYAVSRGKRSFAALLPDNAYGSVVEAAFQHVGIADWEGLVTVDPALVRPVDSTDLTGDATLARRLLGWAPTVEFAELVGRMNR